MTPSLQETLTQATGMAQLDFYTTCKSRADRTLPISELILLLGFGKIPPCHHQFRIDPPL